MPSYRKRHVAIGFAIVAGLVLYAAAYAVARKQTVLVHRSAYVSDGSGNRVVDNHRVEAGDRKGDWIAPMSSLLFTPLRWAEAWAWNWARPAGSAF